MKKITSKINYYCEKFNFTYEFKGSKYLCFYFESLPSLEIQQEIADAFSEFSVFIMRADRQEMPLEELPVSENDIAEIRILLESCKTVDEFLSNI